MAKVRRKKRSTATKISEGLVNIGQATNKLGESIGNIAKFEREREAFELDMQVKQEQLSKTQELRRDLAFKQVQEIVSRAALVKDKNVKATMLNRAIEIGERTGSGMSAQDVFDFASIASDNEDIQNALRDVTLSESTLLKGQFGKRSDKRLMEKAAEKGVKSIDRLIEFFAPINPGLAQQYTDRKNKMVQLAQKVETPERPTEQKVLALKQSGVPVIDAQPGQFAPPGFNEVIADTGKKFFVGQKVGGGGGGKAGAVSQEDVNKAVQVVEDFINAKPQDIRDVLFNPRNRLQPLASAIGRLMSKAGLDAPTGAKLDTALGNLALIYTKFTQGSRPSDFDLEFIRKVVLPQRGDFGTDLGQAKLEVFMRIIQVTGQNANDKNAMKAALEAEGLGEENRSRLRRNEITMEQLLKGSATPSSEFKSKSGKTFNIKVK